MSSNAHDISLITATLNCSDTILDNINSIRAQSVDVEHVVIDGASTDSTLEILQKAGHPFAHVVSEPDDGMYDAMNKGIKLASGKIIGILNADDFYPHAQVLEKVTEVFSNPAVDSCYGDLMYVDSRNTRKVVRYWRSGDHDRCKFYHGWMPPHPTFFVRRSVYEKYGLFDLSLGSAADYELMLRFLLKHKISCIYIPEVLVHMRTGGESNISLKNRLLANQKDRLAWKINHLKPYPWTLFFKPLRKIPQYFKRPSRYLPVVRYSRIARKS